MSICSVKWCRKTSKTSNFKKDGITFHRFSREPEVAAKWTEATGRENWAPKTTSVLCSRHFTDDCFIVCPQTQRRRLFKDAVPTLHLPVLTSQPIDAGTQTTELESNKNNVTQQIHQELPSLSEDHQTKRLSKRVQSQHFTIGVKNKKLKQLRERLRRAEKKIARLEATRNEYEDSGVFINGTELNHNKREQIEPFEDIMERKSIHIIRL